MKSLGFGEVLWDVIKGRAYLGGAPFNLSAHLSKLGSESYIISRVGNDKRGKSVLSAVKRLKVNSSLIQVDTSHPTGTVDVYLSSSGQPEYTINTNVAYDFIELKPELVRKIESVAFDVFCFGTLAQRAEVSQGTLYKLLRIVNSKHVFYDVNLRKKCYSKQTVIDSLHYANIMKLNDVETKVLSALLYKKSFSNKEFALKIMNDYAVKVVCITKGEDGCAVGYKNVYCEIPGIKTRVKDAVGAGDAFSAGFLSKYCRGYDPFESAVFANKIGAYVASKTGAIPRYGEKIVTGWG
ncbi:MAG: carbohydrate kinase [Elusimicrobiota bacterium]